MVVGSRERQRVQERLRKRWRKSLSLVRETKSRTKPHQLFNRLHREEGRRGDPQLFILLLLPPLPLSPLLFLASGQRTTRTTSASSSTAIVTRRGTPSRKGAVNGEGGETGEMCEGSLVIARWRNHSWYPAIVTGSKNGRLNVKFADGDKSSVSLSHAFPRSQLKRGMLVIAMDDTREGQRGHFSGFTGPTLSDWYMNPLTGGDGVQRVRFVCDQLEVPPATALLCVGGKHTRGIYNTFKKLMHTLDPVV
jgi:hypothetical protein